MCKVLENFTEGKGRNLGLIRQFLLDFDYIYTKNVTPGNKTLGSHLKVDVKSVLRVRSAHNRRGPSELNIVKIPHFSGFF